VLDGGFGSSLTVVHGQGVERAGAEVPGGARGGLVVTGIVGFTLDSPTVSFLILGAVTLLALPLLARLRTPVAALAAPEPAPLVDSAPAHPMETA
jgi:hypothetical protein